MKIWRSFSADHSAKLKIIGTFKTAKDAEEAATIFNALLAVKNKDKGSNDAFSNEIMEVLKRYNFSSFSEHDPEQLELFSQLKPAGNRIIVETDEIEIQALLKVLVHNGAKIKIYSKHDYPNDLD